MQINDKIYFTLREMGYQGAINDKMYAYLREEGYEGTLSEMLDKAGGFKSLTSPPKLITQLTDSGVAFDLLDISKMYQDAEGTVPAKEVGDVVKRVNSEDGRTYLLDREGTGAEVTSVNGTPALRFNRTLFEFIGVDTKIGKPIVAHGTMSINEGSLYWYNREGSGYGPRKWGVIVRDGQYRTFHNDGSITVLSVPEWNTYHDVYWNRQEGEITLDGVKESFTGSSYTTDEVYEETDAGLRLGGYSGTTTESITGIVTYFVLSSSPLDEEKLSDLASIQREKLKI